MCRETTEESCEEEFADAEIPVIMVVRLRKVKKNLNDFRFEKQGMVNKEQRKKAKVPTIHIYFKYSKLF